VGSAVGLIALLATLLFDFGVESGEEGALAFRVLSKIKFGAHLGEMGKVLLDRGEIAEAVTHLEAAARLSPQTDYVHYQLQAAYRKEGRTGDADRELELYKNLKAKQRQRASAAVPPQTP
jgi:Flp pilus assembly protein TadD